MDDNANFIPPDKSHIFTWINPHITHDFNFPSSWYLLSFVDASKFTDGICTLLWKPKIKSGGISSLKEEKY